MAFLVLAHEPGAPYRNKSRRRWCRWRQWHLGATLCRPYPDSQQNAWPSFQAAVYALPGELPMTTHSVARLSLHRSRILRPDAAKRHGFSLILERRNWKGGEPDCCGCAGLCWWPRGRKGRGGQPVYPKSRRLVLRLPAAGSRFAVNAGFRLCLGPSRDDFMAAAQRPTSTWPRQPSFDGKASRERSV